MYKSIVSGVLVVFTLFVLLIVVTSCGYMEIVDESEVAVTFNSGQLQEILGPGFYYSLSPFADIETFSSSAIPFSVSDPEIITLDKQRIGLTINGNAFRPGIGDVGRIRSQWVRYNTLWLNEEVLRERVTALGQQAMKVCVGNNTFDDVAIGSGRDLLRDCIEEELGTATDLFVVSVADIAVPEVTISAETQAQLDAITQSRLQAEQWVQTEKEERARTEAELAKEQGKIRVEQGKRQEAARQEATLAALDVEKEIQNREVELAKVETRLQILAAEKAQAEARQEVVAVERETARIEAESQYAAENVWAGIMQDNPRYGEFLVQRLMAETWSGVDKMIVPENSDIMFFNPEETTPVIPALPNSN